LSYPAFLKIINEVVIARTRQGTIDYLQKKLTTMLRATSWGHKELLGDPGNRIAFVKAVMTE